MIKEQMEEAVDEMRQIIAAFEQGALQAETPGQLELLRKILRGREARLRGEILVSVACARDRAARREPEWPNMERQLAEIADGAQMYTRAQALEVLRSSGRIGYMNHEPLRRVEREWLDRTFIGRERVSKGWLSLAAVMATCEETGMHVEDHLQVPCRCSDVWKRPIRSVVQLESAKEGK